MSEAAGAFAALDGIAAAAGPGLIGGVIVGLTTAKAIALVHEKPLIAVNHLEAHALTARLTDGAAFPYCLFLAPADIRKCSACAASAIIAASAAPSTTPSAKPSTRPQSCSALVIRADRWWKRRQRRRPERFALPRPMTGRADANFSLSGLKTAVRLEAEKIAPLERQDVADLCASFQLAVGEVVIDRLRNGLAHIPATRSASQRRWSAPAASPPIRRSARSCTGVAFEIGVVAGARRRRLYAPTTAR